MKQRKTKISTKKGTTKSTAKTRSESSRTSKKTKKISKPKKNVLAQNLEKWTEQISNIFQSRPKDTVAAIKMDHDSLRNFLGILKDTEQNMTERRRAYDLFSSLLKSHTDAEEGIVYKTADKMVGREMHIKTAEGYVEHKLAEDLMKRIEACTDALEWSAHANVLSEIVEHHLKEEERDLLPLIKKGASAKIDSEMLVEYLALRGETQTKITDKNAGSLELLK